MDSEIARPVDRYLFGFVVSVVVLHLMSTLARPLGEIGPTRWADWLDLPTPFVVGGLAAMVLRNAGADRRTWILFVVGLVIYTEGHGIHLAANSIDGFAPGPTVRLWDEPVGHHIWYGGMWVIVAALYRATASRRRAFSPVALGIGGLFGFNAGLNAIEGGGTILLMYIASVVFIAAWLKQRTDYGAYFAAAGLVCFIGLTGWAVAHGGWPQFSELGWI